LFILYTPFKDINDGNEKWFLDELAENLPYNRLYENRNLKKVSALIVNL